MYLLFNYYTKAGGRMTYEYTYRCICECKFQMEIRLKRELDFEVLCVRTDCDLIMNPILESKKPVDLFENQVDFE
jgi:hypothetical protein